MTAPRSFDRFVAIDWSGAQGNRHRGIAVATCATGSDAPVLVAPPGTAWSRTAVLDWLLARRDDDLLVGFDFSFAAPCIERGAYLPGEPIACDARALWRHVDAVADDPDLGAASFLWRHRGTHFYLGKADGRKADFLHYRRCEAHWNAQGGGKPSTVYDAIGAAQVAKASFAGMRLLHRLDGKIPIWPFDPVPASGAAIVEIYTAIAARAAGLRKGLSKLRDPAALDAALAALGTGPHVPLTQYADHATDAMVAAAWLRARNGDARCWHPPTMTPAIAAAEGWTFGIM